MVICRFLCVLVFIYAFFIAGKCSKVNTLVGSKGGITSVEFNDQVNIKYIKFAFIMHIYAFYNNMFVCTVLSAYVL